MAKNLKIMVFNQTVVALMIVFYAWFSFNMGKMLIRMEEKKGLLRPGINIKEF